METVVIKIGGALIGNEDALDVLWTSVRRLRESRNVVVVHGGGPRATEVARRLGHEPQVVHGRRITTDLDLKVVEWTMRGELNSSLIGCAHANSVRAVGISGADGATLQVSKRPTWHLDGEPVDFGWVGDVDEVDPHLLRTLLDSGYVPVVAPLGIDRMGRLFNVNADTVSYEIAAALGADEFLLVTESGGVFEDINQTHSLLRECSRDQFEHGTNEGWIAGGMHVKLEVAFAALDAGIPHVFIVAPRGILNRETGTKVVR